MRVHVCSCAEPLKCFVIFPFKSVVPKMGCTSHGGRGGGGRGDLIIKGGQFKLFLYISVLYSIFKTLFTYNQNFRDP